MKPFYEMRPVVEKQYENICFDPATGWTQDRFAKHIAKHIAEYPDESRANFRAWLVTLVYEHAPVAVEENLPVSGKIQDFGILDADVRVGYDYAKKFVPDYVPWGKDMDRGFGWMVDRSHVAPDWESILSLGIPGLIRRAERGNSAFHRNVVSTYRALAEFCRRAGKHNGNDVLIRIADHAPATLHEAFQLAYIVHDAIEKTGEEVRTMGRFDTLYIGFYRKDLAEGRLTRAEAKELLKYFWMAFYAKYQGRRFGKNFCFGPDFNELSYLGMEVYHELNTVDPKLSVLVRNDMPDDFAQLYIKNIHDGRTGIVSLNYDVIVRGLTAHGRSEEDAKQFIPIGCYEPAVAGKEISCSGATHLYLPAILRNALFEKNDFPTFQDFYDFYLQKILEVVEEMAVRQRRCEKAWPFINPMPLLSGTFASCVSNGKDITEGGAKYNTTGCVVSYLADAVDSLTAIEYLVFERKICTLSELKKALSVNWKGFEKLRWIALRKPPKWGNNDDRADHFGVEIADFVSSQLWNLPNGRGGTFFPSLYGQLVVESGRLLGALPNGRVAGEPVSKNMDSCVSMDRNGITALMNSVLKVDMTRQPCGTCLDLMLHPSSVSGAEGVENMKSIIQTFITRGGSGIQFNIFDASILRDAQKKPEKYENLQVRVCGWNARFTDLEPEAQETFIRQAESIV